MTQHQENNQKPKFKSKHIPEAQVRSKLITSVETMVSPLPTSSCMASPNLGKERRSMACLLRWRVASFRTRVVVMTLTLFPSSLNLYSITFLIPFSSGPMTWRGGKRKSRFSPSSSSNSAHRSFVAMAVARGCVCGVRL